MAKPAQRLLEQAMEVEADGHRRLLAGDAAGARPVLAEAAALYRASWEAAHPRAFGRLVGMLKAAILAGAGEREAGYTRATIGDEARSPTAAYALAIAAAVEGDEEAAVRGAQAMRGGGDAFDRAADGIEALVMGDVERHAAAVRAIRADFARRSEHLTGVPIPDTALMLEELAGRRGLS